MRNYAICTQLTAVDTKGIKDKMLVHYLKPSSLNLSCVIIQKQTSSLFSLFDHALIDLTVSVKSKTFDSFNRLTMKIIYLSSTQQFVE